MMMSFGFDAAPIAPTSITTLPLLPSGEPIALETRALVGPRALGLGGRVWPSAGLLCRYLRRNSGLVAGRAVLELGCGVGAVGIYAAALGAADVTLSDGGSASLLALAEENVHANAGLFFGMPRRLPSVVRYEWGSPSLEPLLRRPGTYDLVLASDVTYTRSAHAALTSSLRQILERCGEPRCVIAHEHRRIPRSGGSAARADGAAGAIDADDDGLVHFCEAARREGLRVAPLSFERQAKQGLRDVSLLDVSL